MDDIRRVLPTIFKSYLERAEPRVVEILSPLWLHVVGKAIAQHTRPVAFVNGTLTVAASCPSWAVQLRGMTEEIRLEVNRYLGSAVVKKLRVKHSPKQAVPGATAQVSDQDSSSNAWLAGDPADVTLGRHASGLEDSGRSAGGPQWRGDRAGLDPETARILERSFTKYFSRGQAKVN